MYLPANLWVKLKPRKDTPFLSHDFTSFAFSLRKLTGQAEVYGIHNQWRSMEDPAEWSPSAWTGHSLSFPDSSPWSCIKLIQCFPNTVISSNPAPVVLFPLPRSPLLPLLSWQTSFHIIQMSETLGRLLTWAPIHLRSVSVMNLFTDLPSFQTSGEWGEGLTHLCITGVYHSA